MEHKVGDLVFNEIYNRLGYISGVLDENYRAGLVYEVVWFAYGDKLGLRRQTEIVSVYTSDVIQQLKDELHKKVLCE